MTILYMILFGYCFLYYGFAYIKSTYWAITDKDMRISESIWGHIIVTLICAMMTLGLLICAFVEFNPARMLVPIAISVFSLVGAILYSKDRTFKWHYSFSVLLIVAEIILFKFMMM